MHFAVKISDLSINKLLNENAFAICERVKEDTPVEPGRLYYIERVKGDLAEKTIRIATIDAHGAIKFSTHSTVAIFHGGVSYHGKDETITILGKVVGSYTDF